MVARIEQELAPRQERDGRRCSCAAHDRRFWPQPARLFLFLVEIVGRLFDLPEVRSSSTITSSSSSSSSREPGRAPRGRPGGVAAASRLGRVR
jgi:hypothetical protein